ncbi:unnamed protein product, partial [Brenthis ino]
MLFSKTLLVLLIAILGTSWIPDGRTNGLASGCWSSVKRPEQCVEKKDPTKVSTIDDIPQEDDEFAPLTVGIWYQAAAGGRWPVGKNGDFSLQGTYRRQAGMRREYGGLANFNYRW